jgi:predicted site-specific integrase-resolvase
MPRKSPEPDDSLLTPREVAEMFGVRTTTIARWSRLGVLEPMRTPGGHRRYRLGDVRKIHGRKPEGDVDRKELELDAARLYDQGWSIRKVSEKFGYDYGTMRRVLLKHTTLRSQKNTAG